MGDIVFLYIVVCMYSD